jgi:nickel-dependent lactate racemase
MDSDILHSKEGYPLIIGDKTIIPGIGSFNHQAIQYHHMHANMQGIAFTLSRTLAEKPELVLNSALKPFKRQGLLASLAISPLYQLFSLL